MDIFFARNDELTTLNMQAVLMQEFNYLKLLVELELILFFSNVKKNLEIKFLIHCCAVCWIQILYEQRRENETKITMFEHRCTYTNDCRTARVLKLTS